MAWLVRGAIRYSEKGLLRTEQMRALCNQYRTDSRDEGPEGLVGKFVGEIRAGLKEPCEYKADSFHSQTYKHWCHQNNVSERNQMKSSKFGALVKMQTGVEWKHTKVGNVYTISPNSLA